MAVMLWLALLMVPPMPPQSAYESAAMKEARSLTESAAAAPKDWLLTSERSEFRETGSYAEAVDFYRRLEKSSKWARLLPMGKTAEGRELYVLVVSKDRAFTPEKAARTGKAVVLLQNGIHAGENGGKDAAMMLLRDVLVTRRLAAWLDNVILLSIPVFNADGHEAVSPYHRINENGPERMGLRVNAQRLNLNRDYVKADTPEMRAWLAMYNAWLPDLLIDNHVTDGADYQWDLTIYTHTEGDIAKPMGEWVNGQFLKPFLSALEKDGHVPGWYAGTRGERVAIETFSPRYATGYAAAQGRAAVLVETHSLKSFRTRVWSHYDLMRRAIDTVAADAAGLKKASAEARAPLKPGTRVMLAGRPEGEGEPYTLHLLDSERYEGTAAGAAVTRYLAKPVDRPARLVRTLAPSLEVEAPAGYLMPAAWADIADLLRRHGVRVEIVGEISKGTVEEIRFAGVQFAPRPFEGRFLVTAFQTSRASVAVEASAGWWYVPIEQPAARIAMQILEPEAPDSAVRWGFFHSIFEQKEYFSDYVFEPVAEAMLKEDPKLRAEFEARIAKDETFAKTPRARLAWIFERSPYFEPGKDVYPVLRVKDAGWIKVSRSSGR